MDRFNTKQPGVYGTLKGHRRFFSPEDDQRLRQLKSDPVPRTWSQIADRMPGFTARQLRERWCNYISPTLKTSRWTDEEDRELLRLHGELGPRWGVIGGRLGNRSAPDIKNRFQSLRNRFEKSSVRPPTERPPPRMEPAVFGARLPDLNARGGPTDPKPDDESGRDPQPRSAEPENYSIKSILS
jgi:hypothetical protein